MEKPVSVEAAQSEIAELGAWIQELEQRQAAYQNVMLRVAWLNGWLAREQEVEKQDAAATPV